MNKYLIFVFLDAPDANIESHIPDDIHFVKEDDLQKTLDSCASDHSTTLKVFQAEEMELEVRLSLKPKKDKK